MSVEHLSKYDWKKDAIDSYELAIRWKSIIGGFRRPSRPLEMYWAEAAGVIP